LLENGFLGKIEEISKEGVYRGLKELLDDAEKRKVFSSRLQKIQRKNEFFRLEDLI
jgi:hypothetical protein